MKNIIFLLLLMAFSSLKAQNNVCFTIEENPNSTDPALGLFTKYVNVFGCGIYAEDGVADDKVLHAAAIWAELLDNDENGEVDDLDLLNELLENQALLPIFEQDENAAMNTFFNTYNGSGVSAILWQTEMDPSQPGHWGSDATIEEILHTINAIGHVNIYPAAFNLQPNSSLMSAAMDVARGGQFLSVPNNYPPESWYHYDDFTCDYECMAIEYMYWSIVSLMGVLDDPNTCAGIANEWEPCTPSLFQSTDVLMYNLITNPIYKLPMQAPDGNYCPQTTNIGLQQFLKGIDVYPNPSTGYLIIKSDSNSIIDVFNTAGQKVEQFQIEKGNNRINIVHLDKGVYYLKSTKGYFKFVKQ